MSRNMKYRKKRFSCKPFSHHSRWIIY